MKYFSILFTLLFVISNSALVESCYSPGEEYEYPGTVLAELCRLDWKPSASGYNLGFMGQICATMVYETGNGSIQKVERDLSEGRNSAWLKKALVESFVINSHVDAESGNVDLGYTWQFIKSLAESRNASIANLAEGLVIQFLYEEQFGHSFGPNCYGEE